MINSSTLPKGTRALPGLLCGVAGGLVTAGLWILELIIPLNLWLRDFYLSLDASLSLDKSVPELENLIGSLMLAFVVSATTLDCRGAIRQAIVVVFFVILVIGASMVAALWNWYLSPFLSLIAIISSGLFSMIYAAQHSMPCEIVEENDCLRSDDVVSKEEEKIVEKVMVPFSTISSAVERGNNGEH